MTTTSVSDEIPQIFEVSNRKQETFLSSCFGEAKGEIRKMVGEERLIYKDSDSAFVNLPEGVHLKLAIENFMRMMKERKE